MDGGAAKRGKRTTTGGGRTRSEGSDNKAVTDEARSIVLLAVGNVAGLTIKGQLRQAAVNLGYGADAWRLREALYGRAGRWSPEALNDLRRRFSGWRDQEARSAVETDPNRSALAQRLAGIRKSLAEVAQQVDELEAEIIWPGG